MAQHSRIALSRLDKQSLRAIVTLVVKQTSIRIKEGTFRYTAEDIRRQLTFGGDFVYGFGDFFKLVFVRSGTKRSEKDVGRYDILFHLEVELDNTNGLKKDDRLYIMRKKTADGAQAGLEEFLIQNGLTDQPRTADAVTTPSGESAYNSTSVPGFQKNASS